MIAENHTTTSTEIIVAPTPAMIAAENIESALHFDKRFASAARFGGSGRPEVRNLTWSTGNNARFAANGKTPLEPARGFHIDKPNEDEMSPWDYEFMDAVEALCSRGLARECVVVHTDPKTQQTNKVPSYEIIDPSLFIVCEGIPSREDMASESCRWGVAYGWNGKASSLRFRCFVKELMEEGYNGAFTVSFSSYCTGKALSVLGHQEYVLNFAKSQREALKALKAEGSVVIPEGDLPYYAYALRIKCSSSTLTAGKEAGKTTQVYYPICDIPRLSVRNLGAAAFYLDSVKITEEQAFILEYNGFVEECVAWSVRETARIIHGNPSNSDVIEEDHPF